MDRNEYENILKFLREKLDVSHWKQDDISRIREKAKEFEVQNDSLYKRRKDGKLLQVIREDEVDTIYL